MDIAELRKTLHAIIDQSDERFLRMVYAMSIEYQKTEGFSIVEKRDYIHNYLHLLSEPVLNEIYDKMVSLVNEPLVKESGE